LQISFLLQNKTVFHAGEALSSHALCKACASLEAASVYHHPGAVPRTSVDRNVIPVLAGLPLLPDHDGAHTAELDGAL